VLIGRTIGMLYYGASVNEKSREALTILREVPNKSFAGVDVSLLSVFKALLSIIELLQQYHRLLDVLHSDTVALSGYRFFFVTKGMILTVIDDINY
jgi:hypothetical protein